MTTRRYRRAKTLFLRCVELDDGEWGALLERECGDDVELRAHVGRLLRADRDEDRFDAVPRPAPPERLGGYRILGVLGEGGMGVVYRAHQENPSREVALKVMRPGRASADALRRFEDEARILGRLQHAGIAQIHEAGAADTGAGPQPFFALELVEGRPIHEAAVELELPARLLLFLEVCAAVEHAHQKGVIHRDLKPANILVDADGRPKILDFGIARLADENGGSTRLTAAGEVIGTLGAMSPEQLSGDPRDIDVRSDVYSLGVVLYELLSGRPPLDVDRCSLAEAARRVRDDDVVPLGRHDTRLRGDLQTIVQHALEKDKERRYPSAAALADDVRRHLAHQPLTARPTTTFEHLRKFARRHRGLVAGLTMALLSLVAGTVVSLRLAFAKADEAARATREEERAQVAAATARAAARDAEDAARRARRAQERAERSEAEAVAARSAAEVSANQAWEVSEFLGDLFEGADPSLSPTLPSLQDLVDRGVQRIRSDLQGQPAVRARLLAILGRAYGQLGFLGPGLELVEEARALHEELSTDPRTDEALAEVLYLLGDAAGKNHQFEDAVRAMRQALEIRLGLHGDDAPMVAVTRTGLGAMLDRSGRLDEAEEELQRARSTLATAPGHEADLGECLSRLGMLWLSRGEEEAATPLLREALALWRRSLPADHPKLAQAHSQLGDLALKAERFDEAEEHFETTLASLEKVLPSGHPNLAITRLNLSVVQVGLEDFEAAERSAAQVLNAARDGPLPAQVLVAPAYAVLGRVAVSLEEWELASERVAMGLEVLLGDDVPRDPQWQNDVCEFAVLLRDLGVARRDQGKAERALSDLQQACSLAARSGRADLLQSFLPLTIDLYDQLGQGHAAEALRARLEQLRSEGR